MKYLKNTALVFLCALPPSVILYEILFYGGGLPSRDYWHALTLFINKDLSLNILGLFSPQNEHIQLIPRLLLLLNIHVFDGHDLPMSLWAFAMSVVQLVVCFYVARKYLYKQRWNILIIVSAFTFTPLAMHNWMVGMSGVHWLTANAFAVGAFALLERALLERSPRAIALMGILAVLSALCYSTGLLVIPTILFVYALGTQKLSRIVIVSAILVCAVALYFLFVYHRPAYHTAITVDALRVGLILFHTIQMLGIFLVREYWLAALVGLFAASFCLYNLWILFRGEEEQWKGARMFASALCVYSVLCMVSFGLSRLDLLGPSYIMSSRYQTLPGLFWIGLMLCMLFRYPDARAYIVIAAAVIIVLLMQFLGFSNRMHLRITAIYNEWNRLGFFIENPFVGVIADVASYQHILAVARGYGHVPFSSRYRVECDEDMRQRELKNIPVAVEGEAVKVKVIGLTQEGPNFKPYFLTEFTTPSHDNAADCAFFVDEAGRILGMSAPRNYLPSFMKRKEHENVALWQGMLLKEDGRHRYFLAWRTVHQKQYRVQPVILEENDNLKPQRGFRAFLTKGR